MASIDENATIPPSTLSVQELIKRPMASVPGRFVRLDQDPHVHPPNSNQLPMIPTIDMKKVLELSDKSSNDELNRLHLSCQEWGIFQVRG